VQNTWSRAGATPGTVGRLAVMTVAAALLAAGITLPAIAIAGIATRDAADTFNSLSVGTLGSPPTYSTLYDAEGQPIATFYPGDVYRVPVTYNEIAPTMRDAIVAIEDDGFYNQGALDPRGTIRAFFSDNTGGQLQGGSTLAQQYVKNVRVLQAGQDQAAVEAATYPDLQRKIQQLRLAATVEHELTQNQLLADYLNVAYFDHHAWGIQVAAEVYFSEPASALNLQQAALLAGLVQSPSLYDPVANPGAAKARRNEVLGRMAQLGYVTQAQATAAEQTPLGLRMSSAPLQTGCYAPSAARSAFFCSYVQHYLLVNYPSIWNQIQSGSGGLKIYSTMNMRDQDAAEDAVSYVEPQHSSEYNGNDNADTEVMIQPGTGAVRAIGVNRTFGTGPGEDDIDYAVNSEYGGYINGVQTGSSSKIFTLITALKQGVPFGHSIKVVSPTSVGPYFNCQNQFVGNFSLSNAEGPTGKGGEIYQLYSATVGSINVYFAHLEQQVGLCNVVQTAVDMGMTRADGTSLLQRDPTLGGNGYPADDDPSFTLGSVGVSPMSMAAAYASVAARGWYCTPDPLSSIVVANSGKSLHLQPDSCHRDMSQAVADAANYILKGVLVSGTAAGRAAPIGHSGGIAGKTGTANSGYYAAFAGYTPRLAAYVSVFNPIDPTFPSGEMLGYPNSCYREVPTGAQACPGQMYGDNAPAATWEYSFMYAALGPDVQFVGVPSDSIFWSEGPGTEVKTISPPGKHHGTGGGPPGGQPPTPPTPLHHHH
jgi:membrane peptidoglycan carboxypeptidase